MKCKHTHCHCKGTELQPDGYCSDACRQGKMATDKCTCGHPACK